MSNRILFRGFESIDRGVGLGDIFDYSQVCYLKGKDMGFDEVHIVFPRLGQDGHTPYGISEEQYNYQETKFLPWKWYPRNSVINKKEWDLIIDTRKSDSLYEGFPGIRSIFWHVSQYLSSYYQEKGIKPYLDIERNILRNPYILFQYRSEFPKGFESASRVTVDGEFQQILNIIRNEVGTKYSFWKMGDTTPLEIQFEKIIPYMYNNLDGLVELISNASLIITAHGGIMNLSFLVRDLPSIIIGLSPNHYTGHPNVWRNRMKRNCKVDRHPNWGDNKTLFFERGKEIDRTKVQTFLEEQKNDLRFRL